MRKYLLFIALLVTGGFLSSCETIHGSGDMVDEIRIISSSYTGIVVESGIVIEFSNALAPDEIDISGDSNILPYTETYVNNSGSLVIKYKNKVNIKTRLETVVVLPEVTNLRYIRASGGSSVTGSHSIQSGTFDIDASGGSKVVLVITCQNLNVEGSGGSKIEITGVADDADVELSGGSELRKFGLTVDTFECELSGGSLVEVICTRSLTVEASGGSKVYYKGDCSVNAKSITGGSEIVKK